MTEINEIWRPIEGFEGLYKVSNLGRVKSLRNYGGVKERIMKPYKTKWGYLGLTLRVKGKVKWFPIHRLVAEAFIPNTDNLPQVNHKDECKTNNRVDNLEWMSCKDNVNYGTGIQRRVEKYKKKVNQYTKDGVFIKQWDSPKDAADYLGISVHHIYSVCSGKRKKTGGYIWRYA